MSREDHNYDGKLDFFISGIDEIDPDMPDQIVLTTFMEGLTPRKAIPLDEAFDQIYQIAYDYVSNPQGFLQSYDQTVCTQTLRVEYV